MRWFRPPPPVGELAEAFVLIDFLDGENWLGCIVEPLPMWAVKRDVELPPGTNRILLGRTDSAL